ncbi:hypothetical protein [Longispora albida]|uniref:hypothetical protein n=1 Tax=Longispora albida TaxID=203523 RepID=UPI00039D3636|nr:hypothetical protein [Longispora albida]
MPLYVGRWGGELIAMPDPLPGVSATMERRHGEHQLLGGGRVVEFAGAGRRSYTFRWERLTDDEYAALEHFHAGTHGPGPLALVSTDTGWNYLPANVASGTDARGDTTGWFPLGAGETVASDPAPDTIAGRRVLAWSLPANPAGPDAATLATAASAIPGGTRYTLTAHARASRPVTLSLGGDWVGNMGAVLGSFAAPAVAIGAAGWTQLTVTATAPAGTLIRAMPLLRATPSTVTAPTTVYLDALSATYDGRPAPALWRPGRGVPMVSLTELTDDYPWSDVHDCTATFVEVG